MDACDTIEAMEPVVLAAIGRIKTFYNIKESTWQNALNWTRSTLQVEDGREAGIQAVNMQLENRASLNDAITILRRLSRDEFANAGADVITGFPGESDELFEETYRFLAELPVSYLHVFTYSSRPDTPAAASGGPSDSERVFGAWLTSSPSGLKLRPGL